MNLRRKFLRLGSPGGAEALRYARSTIKGMYSPVCIPMVCLVADEVYFLLRWRRPFHVPARKFQQYSFEPLRQLSDLAIIDEFLQARGFASIAALRTRLRAADIGGVPEDCQLARPAPPALWSTDPEVFQVLGLRGFADDKYLVAWQDGSKPSWVASADVSEDLKRAYRQGRDVGPTPCPAPDSLVAARRAFPDAVSGRSSKAEANRIWAGLLQQSAADARHAYLDGHQGNTTEHLQGGVLGVLIPLNHSDAVVQALRAKFPGAGVTPQCFWVHHYLVMLQRQLGLGYRVRLDSLWLDYCCTLEGNRKCSPQKDIALLFRSGILAGPGALLGCTFSQRGQTTKSLETLQCLAAQHGVRLEVVTQMTYHPSMIFIVLRLL